MKKLIIIILLLLPVISFADFDLHAEISRLADKYGQDPRLASRIIDCESGHDVLARNLHSVIGVDVGLWQINTYWQKATAEKLGFDIEKTDDNLEYGFWLLRKEGTRPWNASKYCWSIILLAQK